MDQNQLKYWLSFRLFRANWTLRKSGRYSTSSAQYPEPAFGKSTPVKAYGNQKLRRNKSDTADAKLIAQFLKSEQSNLINWEPQPLDNEKITELSRYAESITRDNARLKTKCEATTKPLILRSLKRRIKAQEKEIEAIRKQINKIIQGNETLKFIYQLLKSIPGIGEVCCHIVIAELPDISLFSNARQLAAWAGLTPQHHQSGTSGRTTTPITKIGSAHLRSGLFMPAMNARVFNPLLKTFADRLKENGKKPKQIIIAVMRKLLHQIYGILKSGEPYNPEKRGFQNNSKQLKTFNYITKIKQFIVDYSPQHLVRPS